MPAWLQTLRPGVLDEWLTYSAVEPEAFAVGSGPGPPGTSRDTERGEHWIPSDKIGEYWGKRYG